MKFLVDISMESNKISNLADGVNAQDAVTKKQLDAVAKGGYQPKGNATFNDLPATPSASYENFVYNMTEAFTVDNRFVEYDAQASSQKTFPAGSNIAVLNVGTTANPSYKFEVLGGFIDLSDYLTKTGDGSDVTAAFSTAQNRSNISTGEKLSVIFGKIAKYFADLGAAAFVGTSSTPVNNGTDAFTTGGAFTQFGKIIKVASGTISANTANGSAQVTFGATSTLISYRTFDSVTGDVVMTDVNINKTTGIVTFTTVDAHANAITCEVVYKEA